MFKIAIINYLNIKKTLLILNKMKVKLKVLL
jgi:hypothetical protein